VERKFDCDSGLKLIMICENCGYEVREGKKHNGDGEGHCQIVETDTERVVGFANRRERDPYKEKVKKGYGL
jgi:hypothetical protein